MKRLPRPACVWLLATTSLGCARLVGADFDGLEAAPASAYGGEAAAGRGAASGSSGSAGADGDGGRGGGAVGEAGQAGQGGDGGAGGLAGGAGAGGAIGPGGSAGKGGAGSAGKGGTSSAGQGGVGGGTAGSAGTGSVEPVPPRICGDMTGLDEEAPWPMEGACPTRIGRAAGPLKPLGIPTVPVYQADLGSDSVSGGAATDSAGNVYVMSQRIDPGKSSAAVLRIFDAGSASTGELVLPNEVSGTVVLTRFGGEPSVLVSTTFQLRLVDRAGKNVLGGVASPGGFLSGSPVVSGGTVFFSNALGELHAWRPEDVASGDDHVVYESGNQSPSLQSPAVGPDGTIYFTTLTVTQDGGMLHAVTLTQNPLKLTKKWAVPFAGSNLQNAGSRVAVAGDGTVVFATTAALLGFDSAGKSVFSVSTDAGASLPTIVGDRIFHAGTGGTIMCVTTKGKKIYESPGGYGAQFVATSEGYVTYGAISPSRVVRTIDYANGTLIAQRDTASIEPFGASRLSLDVEGRVLFAGGNKLTAYGVP